MVKSNEDLGGDLAELGKKPNTDHDFPPPLYVVGK